MAELAMGLHVYSLLGRSIKRMAEKLKRRINRLGNG